MGQAVEPLVRVFPRRRRYGESNRKWFKIQEIYAIHDDSYISRIEKIMFLPENFLLSNKTSENLYFDIAEHLPIYDYHCHLAPEDIADNRRFENLTQIWLVEGRYGEGRYGDHYKWRAMRANGVPERFITGDASDYEKFLAFARTVPATIRNPLYHWTHLELRRYFGIAEILNEETAPKIWAVANEQLQALSVHEILKKFRVSVICTTDDPVDDLSHHQALRNSNLSTRVYPAFRPDAVFGIGRQGSFSEWIKKLEKTSQTDCSRLSGLLQALRVRHDYFGSQGSKLSDHGLPFVYSVPCDESEASEIYRFAWSGNQVDDEKLLKLKSYLLRFFGELDSESGWVKQLHLGALRNVNTRALNQLGPDTGYDSIGDWPQAEALARYLDQLEVQGKLPKMLLYNLNPADNYLFATMIGNFQDGAIPGKIQFGSGWWFLDQKEGMEWQLNALSSAGLLSRFVGMLTDSRSFMSYPRHEYFRRILCNLLGKDIENGEIPNDKKLLGNLIRGICFENARNYFALEC
jgi:glucuronate isomerase